jgi:hypothetical protein
MAVYDHNTFVGQRIQVDGHVFTNNVFQNCVLVYGGGPLSFSSNVLNSVRWEFVDAAARTLGLIAAFYQGGGEGRRFVELMLATFGKPTQPPGVQQAQGAGESDTAVPNR